MYTKVLFLVFFLFFQDLAFAQKISFRSFEEMGGTVTTGNAGSIASLSNGDIILANERYTNFSQKGIQLMRLDAQSMLPVLNRAYFNNFTIDRIQIRVRDDSVYILAQHNNGGVYKLLFLVFDKNLELKRSWLSEAIDGLLVYSFWLDTNGSFRVYGAIISGGAAERFILSLDATGVLLWSKKIGPGIGFWGGSSLLENGTLVAGTSRSFAGIDRNGNLLWSRAYDADWTYTINGAAADGEAIMTRSADDSTLIYSMMIGADGRRKGQTAGVYMNPPLFTAVLPDKRILVGSSSFSFAEGKVTLKISEFNAQGVFVINHHIDNVFGFAPVGSIRDACRYAVHVDAQGNFYVLGIANRQGFFVMRLEQDLEFNCSYFTDASQPSPVPEENNTTFSMSNMPFEWQSYTFTEEQASQYRIFCSSCGGKFQQTLKDTALCLGEPSYTLDAGNLGATYLWSDGSTGKTLSISKSGTYWVKMTSTCDTIYDTVEVVIHEKPNVKLSFSPNAPIPGELVTFVGEPDTFSTMNWYFGDTLFAQGSSVSWTSDKNGFYYFAWEVYDEPSCRGRDSIAVKFSLIDYYFPDAFTPNQDGLNDTWGPVGSGIQKYQVRIYNRWGQQVYAGENRAWDGTHKGTALIDGHYKYIVVLVDDDNIKREYKGVIHLIN